MALCHITGTVQLPDGTNAAGRILVFKRNPETVVAQSGHGIVPDEIAVKVAADGTVDFKLYTGNYIGFLRNQRQGNERVFKFPVPEAATALFQDILQAVDPVEPLPSWLTEAFEARDDAEGFADDAEAAADRAAANAALVKPQFDSVAQLQADMAMSVSDGATITVNGIDDYIVGSDPYGFQTDGGVDVRVDLRKGGLQAPALFLDGGTRADWMRAVNSASTEISTQWYGRYIEVPAGKYEIPETIRIPPFLRVVAKGSVELIPTSDFAANTPVLHVSYDEGSDPRAFPSGFPQTPFNAGKVLNGDMGAFIVCDHLERGNITAYRFGLNTLDVLDHRRHTAWTEYSNIQAMKMGVAYEFTNKQTYMQHFYGALASNCAVGIQDNGSTSVNSGEAISWYSPFIGGCDVNLRVRSQINHTFYHGHFDFSKQGVSIEADYCQVRFIGGWVEKANTRSDTPATSLDTSLDVPFVNSTLENATDGRQAVVTIRDTHFFPRDRLPAQMFKGHFALDFSGNQLHLDRFSTAADQGRRGEGLFLCDSKVQLLAHVGNSNLESPQFPSVHTVKNQNAFFSYDADGTVADYQNLNTITGWTVMSAIAAGATYTITDDDTFYGGKCVSVTPGSGNYAGLISNKFPVSQDDRVFCDMAMKIPPSMTGINVTFSVQFYSLEGAPIGSPIERSSNETGGIVGNTGEWISTRNGTGNSPMVPPTGAASATMSVQFGGLAGNTIKVGAAFMSNL